MSLLFDAVSAFGDGGEIALNYRAEYDIILMDIQMRYMDGMTAATPTWRTRCC